MAGMREDLKTGVSIWHKISRLRSFVLQFCIFAAASVLTVHCVNPALADRMEAVFKADVQKVYAVFIVVHVTAVCFMMKRVVNETYRANRDFFWQLTISKNSECVCMMLQKIVWYYYYILILLAVSGRNMAGAGLLLFGATLFYGASFAIHCRTTDRTFRLKKENRMNHSLCSTKKRCFNRMRNHPFAELIFFSVSALYKCVTLAVMKAALVILLIYLGEIHVLNGKIFFLAEAALVLLNDGYWRKESCNFPYFSYMGISVEKYLLVHILAGIWFNTIIPVLVFALYTRKIAVAVVLWATIVFLIVFWYMTQIYLYLTIDKKRELTITQCSILFLIVGLFPVINIAAAVLLYKRIRCRWRG